MRENKPQTLDLNCPHCHKPQRTLGWLNWHIKNKHNGVSGVNSPAPAGDLTQEFRDRYANCEVCGCMVYIKLHPEQVGFIQFCEGGPKVWCRDCVTAEGLIKYHKGRELVKV